MSTLRRSDWIFDRFTSVLFAASLSFSADPSLLMDLEARRSYEIQVTRYRQGDFLKVERGQAWQYGHNRRSVVAGLCNGISD